MVSEKNNANEDFDSVTDDLVEETTQPSTVEVEEMMKSV